MSTSKGEFIGTFKAEFLEDGRNVRLLEDFIYKDSNGKEWFAPAGIIVNGASIPRVLWTIVGSPYTGQYRNASVVHDHYCDTRTESWQLVHRMFHEACVTGGVSELQAKIMYSAVYIAGPRWELIMGVLESSIVKQKTLYPEKFIEENQYWIEQDNPTLEEIEERAKSHITTIPAFD